MYLTEKRKVLQKIKDIDRQKAQLGLSIFDEKDKIKIEKIYDTLIDILMKYTDIEIIDQKKSIEIVETFFLNSPGDKPIGLFLLPPDKNTVPFWTAIDNFSGQAFCEDFETKVSAVRWLLKYND